MHAQPPVTEHAGCFEERARCEPSRVVAENVAREAAPVAPRTQRAVDGRQLGEWRKGDQAAVRRLVVRVRSLREQQLSRAEDARRAEGDRRVAALACMVAIVGANVLSVSTQLPGLFFEGPIEGPVEGSRLGTAHSPCAS